MLAHIGEQDKRIDSQAQAIKWRDPKIESITLQLARLKAWKFGAKTEAMNAEQRDIFEETLRRSSACSVRFAASGSVGAAGCSCRSRQHRKSLTTRCQHRACKPIRWSAASSIKSPTIGKSKSTHAKVFTRRARRWLTGAGTPARS